MADVPQEKRTEVVRFRLTTAGLRVLDDLRGAESRSAYMRRLLRYGQQRQIYGPRKVDDDL